jgi:N-methylhydantoinase B
MPIEAPEHTGPILAWRKELRPDSGGAGRLRGGLGQVIEIAPAEGHEFDFSAMFDRVNHPARGRDSGGEGAPGVVALDDGTQLRPKGWQHVPAGKRLILKAPGGGGFGPAEERSDEERAADMLAGYVTEDK